MKTSQVGFWLLPVLMAGVLVLACKRTHYTYGYAEPADKSGLSGGRPEILFATFVIRQRDTTTTMELREKNVVHGRLKATPENSGATDRLYVAVLDNNKSELSGFYIEHPLRKNVEYTNEANELAIKFIELREAEFFIRTPLDPQSRFVRVDDVRGDRVVSSFLFGIR